MDAKKKRKKRGRVRGGVTKKDDTNMTGVAPKIATKKKIYIYEVLRT